MINILTVIKYHFKVLIFAFSNNNNLYTVLVSSGLHILVLIIGDHTSG